MPCAEDENEVEDDNDVVDDETLNEMMARSPEELQIFQRMDKEREQADKQWMNSLRRTRLMAMEELPPWLRRNEDEVDKLVEYHR